MKHLVIGLITGSVIVIGVLVPVTIASIVTYEVTVSKYAKACIVKRLDQE